MMKTLLIIWFVISGNVSTNSVKSLEFPSLVACEEYAKAVMDDSKALSYQCIEGYSLPVKGG